MTLKKNTVVAIDDDCYDIGIVCAYRKGIYDVEIWLNRICGEGNINYYMPMYGMFCCERLIKIGRL